MALTGSGELAGRLSATRAGSRPYELEQDTSAQKKAPSRQRQTGLKERKAGREKIRKRRITNSKSPKTPPIMCILFTKSDTRKHQRRNHNKTLKLRIMLMVFIYLGYKKQQKQQLK
jgi:hypothetical protein